MMKTTSVSLASQRSGDHRVLAKTLSIKSKKQQNLKSASSIQLSPSLVTSTNLKYSHGITPSVTPVFRNVPPIETRLQDPVVTLDCREDAVARSDTSDLMVNALCLRLFGLMIGNV